MRTQFTVAGAEVALHCRPQTSCEPDNSPQRNELHKPNYAIAEILSDNISAYYEG